MRPGSAEPSGAGPVLSVLETAPVGPGGSGRDALAGALAVARAAERLGFRRLWLAEHHGATDTACTSPTVLIAHVAAHTTRLRIGSGGVLLGNQAPLLLAEQFRTLENLHPGRIDLGVGRGRGAEQPATKALRRNDIAGSTAGFLAELAELTGFLDDSFRPWEPFARVRLPAGGSPRVHLLGSSPGSARLAGERGLPYAFAGHLRPDATDAAVAEYRAAFVPSPRCPEPYVIVSVGVVCLDTATAAREAAETALLARVRFADARRSGTSADPARLRDPATTPRERELVARALAEAAYVIGDPATVTAELARMHLRTGADELMLASFVPDAAVRTRTLAGVADGFGRPETLLAAS